MSSPSSVFDDLACRRRSAVAVHEEAARPGAARPAATPHDVADRPRVVEGRDPDEDVHAAEGLRRLHLRRSSGRTAEAFTRGPAASRTSLRTAALQPAPAGAGATTAPGNRSARGRRRPRARDEDGAVDAQGTCVVRRVAEPIVSSRSARGGLGASALSCAPLRCQKRPPRESRSRAATGHGEAAPRLLGRRTGRRTFARRRRLGGREAGETCHRAVGFLRRGRAAGVSRSVRDGTQVARDDGPGRISHFLRRESRSVSKAPASPHREPGASLSARAVSCSSAEPRRRRARATSQDRQRSAETLPSSSSRVPSRSVKTIVLTNLQPTRGTRARRLQCILRAPAENKRARFPAPFDSKRWKDSLGLGAALPVDDGGSGRLPSASAATPHTITSGRDEDRRVRPHDDPDDHDEGEPAGPRRRGRRGRRRRRT